MAWGRRECRRLRLMLEYFIYYLRSPSTWLCFWVLIDDEVLFWNPLDLVWIKLFLVVQLLPVCPTKLCDLYFNWAVGGRQQFLGHRWAWTWRFSIGRSVLTRYALLCFQDSCGNKFNIIPLAKIILKSHNF